MNDYSLQPKRQENGRRKGLRLDNSCSTRPRYHRKTVASTLIHSSRGRGGSLGFPLCGCHEAPKPPLGGDQINRGGSWDFLPYRAVTNPLVPFGEPGFPQAFGIPPSRPHLTLLDWGQKRAKGESGLSPSPARMRPPPTTVSVETTWGAGPLPHQQ